MKHLSLWPTFSPLVKDGILQEASLEEIDEGGYPQIVFDLSGEHFSDNQRVQSLNKFRSSIAELDVDEDVLLSHGFDATGQLTEPKFQVWVRSHHRRASLLSPPSRPSSPDAEESDTQEEEEEGGGQEEGSTSDQEEGGGGRAVDEEEGAGEEAEQEEQEEQGEEECLAPREEEEGEGVGGEEEEGREGEGAGKDASVQVGMEEEGEEGGTQGDEDMPSWLQSSQPPPLHTSHTSFQSEEGTAIFEVFGVLPPSLIRHLAAQRTSLHTTSGEMVRLYMRSGRVCANSFWVEVEDGSFEGIYRLQRHHMTPPISHAMRLRLHHMRMRERR